MAYVKTNDGHDMKVPSQGQANLNTVLGAVGTYGTLGGFNGNGGLLGNLFGWNRGNYGCSPADMAVTRYEMAMQNELAQKDSKIALLEANIFTDTKIADVFEKLSARINAAEAVLAQQAVRNQAFNDALAATDFKFTKEIQLEAERRQCADCKIVNYVNSTFAPRLITDYTAGTTSTVAQVYNPLACGQCCGGGNTFAGPVA